MMKGEKKTSFVSNYKKKNEKNKNIEFGLYGWLANNKFYLRSR